MLEKMVTPLLVVRAMGELRGKTRMQKLACLVESSLRAKGRPIGYRFQLYHYGPFSFDLSRIVQDLVDQGLLLEKPLQTANGNVQYSYFLSEDGKRLVEDLLRREAGLADLANDVSTIVGASGYLSLDRLVAEAYEAYEAAAEG